jgi:hypothetical protein
MRHQDYEILERAVARGERLALRRRGTEYLVIPLALRAENGREVIDARNPTTGDELALYLDELDAVEHLGGPR